MRRLARVLLLSLLGLLVGCVPQRSVRVEPADSGPRPRSVPSGLYEVVRGDTLYGIAFRHGLDYRDLARLNGIAAPYTIYPGQRLRLRGRAPSGPQVAAVPPRSPAAPDRGTPVGTPPRASGEAVTAPAATGAGTPAVPPVPPAATVPPSVPAATTPATSTPRPAAPALPNGPPRWQWPAEGQLAGRYLAGDPTRQGINIAGRSGDPVRATADGVVVYSGSGLIGYGELIIVKHSETWLSAYGHNRRRLVGEGDSVRAGQQIAEMGRTGTSRDMLHFEVRRNGKPVDPLGVLPKR